MLARESTKRRLANTSPPPQLAGIIKDVALIAGSTFIFGNTVTPTQVAGYGLALFGLNCFHRFKAAPTGQSPPLRVLVYEAATDKVMAVMVCGIIALWAISLNKQHVKVSAGMGHSA